MREYSKLEGRDADETLDEIRPLTWEQARRALDDMMTMHEAKEPYAIFKMVPVQVKKPVLNKLYEVFPVHTLASRLIKANLAPGKIIKNGIVGVVKNEKTIPETEVNYIAFDTGKTGRKHSKNFSRSKLRHRAALKQK
jgi:hypothetical protein